MGGTLTALIGSYSPVAGAFESIASATGTGSSGTIIFSSIPGTYQHLQIRGIFRTNRGSLVARVGFTLNNPGGAPFARHGFSAEGSTLNLISNTSQQYIEPIRMTGATAAANQVGVVILDINNYASTNNNKVINSLGGIDLNGTSELYLSSGLFPNTGAITRIDIVQPDGDFFTTATQVALYGIKGA